MKMNNMKTNKITATIVIEIEDSRGLASRCNFPMTKESVLENIRIYSGSNLESKKSIISFKATNPLTEEIREFQKMEEIANIAIAEVELRITDFERVRNCGLLDKKYKDIELSSKIFRKELDNWNWRQDCSN